MAGFLSHESRRHSGFELPQDIPHTYTRIGRIHCHRSGRLKKKMTVL